MAVLNKNAGASTLRRFDPTKSQGAMDRLVGALVRSNPAKDTDGKKESNPSTRILKGIADETTNDIIDAKSVFEILPDTELAMQVLVSSILSPNDLISNELLFSAPGLKDESKLAGQLIKIIEDYFKNRIPLNAMCTPALEDMLFKTGSYPIMMLPSSAIDNIINDKDRVSIESLAEDFDANLRPKPLGILGKASTGTTSDDGAVGYHLGIEHWKDADIEDGKVNNFLTITDNPAILKKPWIIDKIRSDRVSDIYSIRTRSKVSLEKRNEGKVGKEEDGSDKAYSDLAYRKRKYKNTPVLSAVNDGNNVDEPTFIKLPSEAVIPVHVPNSPTEHIGYYILLDDNGNPISRSQSKQHWKRLADSFDSDQQAASEMINRVRNEMFAGDAIGNLQGGDHKKQATLKEINDSYTQVIEKQLRDRLTNGVYGDDVEFEASAEIYRIMTARALKQMGTTILFVPVEMFTYLAFDYNDWGVGESLLSNSKIITSIRAMLMFSNTMAGVKNSIGRTGLNIELDPKDPDPQGTIEYITSIFHQNRKNNFPLGITDPTDVTNYLNKSSVEVGVSGHPGYPTTKLEIEDKQRNMTKVDTEQEEKIRHRHIQSLGLVPELVDPSTGTDFAANVIQGNKLFMKRVMLYQNAFADQLTQMVRKYILISPMLINELLDIIDNDKTIKDKDAFFHTFLEAISVGLPTVDTSKLEGQKEALEQYEGILDTAINSYISTETVDGLFDGDEAEAAVETIKFAVKAHFMRNFMRKNNVLPELDILTTFDDSKGEGFDLLDAQQDHIRGLVKSIGKFIVATRKDSTKFTFKLEEELAKIEEQLQAEQDEAAGYGPDGTSDGGDGLGEDGTGDLGGGGDDTTDLDDGTGLDEGGNVDDGGETPTETPTEEPTADAGGTGGEGDGLDLDL